MVQAAVTAAAAADGYLRRGVCDASLPSFKVNNYAAGKERRMRERKIPSQNKHTSHSFSLSRWHKGAGDVLRLLLCVCVFDNRAKAAAAHALLLPFGCCSRKRRAVRCTRVSQVKGVSLHCSVRFH